MKKFLNTFILAIIFIQTSQASEELIKGRTILGCYQDTMPSTTFEIYAIDRIDSLRLAEIAERYDPYPEITNRYSFEKFQCLKMYSFRRQGPDYPEEDPWRFCLFNLCDSTIYPFGGNVSMFSQVVNDYLAENFKSDEILELLELYLNTLSPFYSYYIVNSPNKFENLIADWWMRKVAGFPEDIFNEHFQQIKDTIKPISIKAYSDVYEVEFYSWRQSILYPFWGLDFWRFRITKESIEIMDRIRVLSR